MGPEPLSEKALAVSIHGEESYDEYDTLEDIRLMRKVDVHLLPILTFLYLLSFLDRSNIGNAKIDGLTQDIGVSNPAYNTSLALYFIAYVTFEVPANIVYASLLVWLPTLTFVWGVVSVFQGFVTSQASLFAVRWLLGATEAGLFPGVVYIFSVYYLRIFILEGLLTIVVSSFAYWWVPTWPDKASFLTPEERTRLQARLAADSDAGKQEEFNWGGVLQALTDPLVWGYSLLFHGFAFVLYTLSLFMPTIIASLGFATWKAQLMTVPPNTLAAIGIGLGAWLAARSGRRAPLIIGAAAIAIVAGPQYVGVLLATLGVYTGNALLLSWPSENVSGQTKRAVAVAMQITIGDLGAVTGVLIYRPAWSFDHYRVPHIVAMGYLLFAITIASVLWWRMTNENRRKEKVLELEPGAAEKIGEAERVRLGDRWIGWRYVV
ncbi:major facilitator superfamily domain-containing protein [Vararia minispora EC-137]|uniref:Major facilitator superfamily domain-containing protein n=1 Tax=Vararia minispora EC-137 TaxID=1314806 RepID=A0ACB8QSQ0_9AGAM|nr:major facilitator superfamily domain-containing protein [Vararia minispora EC-137]